MSFILDARLEQDSLHLADLPLCQLRLSHDARYPWLLLVPRLAKVSEVFDLSAEQQAQLWQEVSSVSALWQRVTAADKINIATLGNVVAQLHVHVVARFQTDAAWPAPIWGRGEAEVYPAEARQALIALLKQEVLKKETTAQHWTWLV